MDEIERRDIEEKLVAVRQELASMREDLNLIREALGRALREWMVEQVEKDGATPN